MPLEEAYTFAGRTMAENMMAKDAEAGIGAFTRKEQCRIGPGNDL